MMTSVRDSKNRTALEAIFIFLVKFRTGISNKLISAIFDLEREQMVSDYTANIITAFEKDILNPLTPELFSSLKLKFWFFPPLLKEE